MIQSNQIPKVKKSSGAFLWLLCRIHLPLGFIILLILSGCGMSGRPEVVAKNPDYIIEQKLEPKVESAIM